MKLPLASVRKLFREDFAEDQPIVVDRANLPAEAKRWQMVIAAIDGCHVTKHPGDRDSRSRTLCRFTIPNPDSDDQYLRRDELRLEYDSEKRLTLHAYRYRESQQITMVSSVDELKNFVRHVLERYARRSAAENKREKIRGFKSRAIVAQVKKLAKEEQFDFAATTDTRKVKLFVKLANHEMIEIQVPFKQFEQVLPKLKSTILHLRELYAEGLRFKMQPVGRLPWTLDWIEHESL
ncbi:hypothetical protein [Roseiconus lacunae]|uniref:hypothetical protein n=1 Tax=Roseiconus lacunae TaxID=2605694 RepID=UPI0011F30511|nr:hypothetical protein [Roseiconus lacunae]MCD0463614.1 hypothetical protein [Roseiconus lacunae]